MPVNIWATVLHLSDGHFSGATDPHRPSLDLLVATKMRKITGNAQVWMINPIWHTPGLTGVLLRESYREMQNASESYLVLITPGFADVTHSIPTDLVQTQLREICRRSRAFNKRSLGILLGVPAGCPEITKEKIARVNMITESTIKEAGGIVVDLLRS